MKLLLSLSLFSLSLFGQSGTTTTVSISFQTGTNNLKDTELARFLLLAPTQIAGTLTAAVTSNATSISVSGTCPANNTAVYIDAEPMLVTAGSGSQTCTVTRNSALAVAGTAAAAHNSGATVAQLTYSSATAYFVNVGVTQFLLGVSKVLGTNSAVLGSALTSIANGQATIAANSPVIPQ